MLNLESMSFKHLEVWMLSRFSEGESSFVHICHLLCAEVSTVDMRQPPKL